MILATIIVAAGVCTASFLPIYPDEVAYKIFLERLWLTGGLKQSVTPFCTTGFLYAPPLTLQPAAWFWTLPMFLGDGWVSYRILPLLAFLGIVSTLLFEGWHQRSLMAILTVVMIVAGATPFGLVIFRPEVFILSLALAIFVVFRHLASPTSFEGRALFSFIAIALYSLVCYLHPKSIYLVPLMIAGFSIAGLRSSNRMGGLALAGFGIAMSIVMTLQAIEMHRTQYLSCPEYPEIEDAMRRQSIDLLQVLRSPADIEKAVKRLTAPGLTAHGIAQLGFNPAPDAGYLPKPPSSILTDIASGAARLALLFALLIGVWELLKAVFRPYSRGPSDRFLIILLWIGLVSPYLLSLTRHWYDAAAFCGGLAITSVLFLARTPPSVVGASTATFSVIAAVTSLSILVRFEVPAFLAGYTGPGISLALNREAVNNAVHKLLSEHGVPTNAPLMVDDLTYESAEDSPVTVPVTYLSLGFSKPDNILFTLRKLNVRYGVARKMYETVLAKLPSFQIIGETVVPGTDQKIILFSIDAYYRGPG